MRLPILTRRERKTAEDDPLIVTYDIETSRIAVGTPVPLFITGYAEHPQFEVRQRIRSLDHLCNILRYQFLTDDLAGAMFVGWNANHFDAYFTAAALMGQSDYVIRPFLTRNKNLRGMRVIPVEDIDKRIRDQRSWSFVDGMAMTGLIGVSLARFLDIFAPDYRKLKELIDFEREEFDADNPAHVEYAMRDSVGLWHGMQAAQRIVHDRFGRSLRTTMGAMCIRILTAHMPEGKAIRPLAPEDSRVVRDYVLRGGFCHCMKSFRGPVWKYDINQAYAAAMRESRLPCGYSYRSEKPHALAPVYMARVTATNPRNRIPFYYRTLINGRMVATTGTDRIEDTWLASSEVDQLRAEGWRIEVRDSIWFDDSFSLTEYVDRLESIRMNCEGGPSGPIGTMIKAIGNHSYGKFSESLDDFELIVARDCPPGWSQYQPEREPEPGTLAFDHLWCRPIERDPKEYHHPQISAFITAHVRMVVRRAALLDPDAFLYADTDCVIFSRDVTRKLRVDAKKYGRWKIESSGEPYVIVTKKVYASADGSVKHAKGLNVKQLTSDDFERWLTGDVPKQKQVQRVNFLQVMLGKDMYRNQERRGTRI